MPVHALALNEKDNVATAIRDMNVGEEIEVAIGDRTRTIALRNPVPYGHKFALTEIIAGQDIIKYGEVIGLASQNILPGDHTHIHNIESKRGRGDLETEKGQS